MNLFAGANFTGVVAFLRSGDGGQTWSVVSMPKFGFKSASGVLAIDPVMTNVIYASTPQHELQVSTDGGVTWTVPSMPNPLPGLKTSAPDHPSISSVAVDLNRAGVVYVLGPDDDSGRRNGFILASSDYGRTWSVLAESLNFSGKLFVDPNSSQILYGTNMGSSVGLVCTATNGGKCGLYKSTDGGKTWAATSMPRALVQSVAFDRAGATIYAWADAGVADVTGGAPGGVLKSADTGVTWTQVLQNVGVATFGKVARVDTANPGTVYSLGPTGGDAVSRSVDSAATWITAKLPQACDRPTDRICPHQIILHDLLILPTAPAAAPTPAISANGVVNAASYQPGVVANSWTTILGTNLAPRTDDWSNSIVDGKLPTSLDGVSVTMGGKPAVVAFISTGQLNVLAPDLPPGSAAVVVTTPAGVSATFTATVSTYNPAFFAWPANQVVATHADYSFTAKSGSISGAATMPAQPGETIVLWGMGFGPTTPAAPVGEAVGSDQVYSTSTTPAVTINNIPATVYGAALSPGSAGLFQIAIQVPAALPDGDWPIQAAIGGVTSPAGTILSVHR
ncbi:MAG TPA: IPT/TIG domain-containing protein [Gemmataceae bacterium]|nr:IPT/TIG domain-containing protein [Gemmataceae bacterium]